MRLIQFIILIISILCIFCSCATKHIKVRGIKVHYNEFTTTFTAVDSSIEMIIVDTGYKVGDVVSLSDGYYRIVK